MSGVDGQDNFVLRMRGITKRFGSFCALDDVDFAVRPGEVHALIGENGAGKSTLMNVLAGRFDDYTGQVEIEGAALRLTNPRAALNAGVAVIYQEPSVVPSLNVAENIMLGQEPGGRLPGAIARSDLLSKAGMLLWHLGFELPLKEPVENLSRARQVLVEIARAVRRQARIIVFDEPTAALGAEDVRRLFAVIRELTSRGLAIIYISHRLMELPRIADRVTVLRDGRIVGTRMMRQCGMHDLTRMMLGRDLDDVFPPRMAFKGERVLRVRHLSRQGVFENISFDLHEGEVLGLAGLVGSGRTEIARAIVGADAADGSVLMRRQPLEPRTPQRCLGAGLCMVPEDRQRDGSITGRPIAENLNAGILRRLSHMLGYLPPGSTRKSAERMIDKMHIDPPLPWMEIQQLSGGNQQKTIVGRVLASAPKVIIFDEPTQGIDVGTKATIYKLIADLAANGRAIILISSELTEIAKLADRILVIREGKVWDEIPGGVDEEALFAACVGERRQ